MECRVRVLNVVHMHTPPGLSCCRQTSLTTMRTSGDKRPTFAFWGVLSNQGWWHYGGQKNTIVVATKWPSFMKSTRFWPLLSTGFPVFQCWGRAQTIGFRWDTPQKMMWTLIPLFWHCPHTVNMIWRNVWGIHTGNAKHVNLCFWKTGAGGIHSSKRGGGAIRKS